MTAAPKKKLALNETESEKAAKTAPAAEPPPQKFKLVETKLVDESPTNPRKHFDAKKLAELAADVRLHGVMQPLLVRPKGERFELIFGHRRLRAAKEAGLAEVPVLIVELGDVEVVERQLVENAKRDDLTALEVAKAYAGLKKDYSFTDEAIAARVGRSVSSVRAALKLTELVPEAVKLLEAGQLTASTGLLVGRLPKSVQVQVVKQLEKDYRTRGDAEFGDDDAPIPFRGLQALIRDEFMLELGPGKSAFDPADATLLEKAGSCMKCPKNTICQQAVFPDEQPGKDAEGICTDLECYRAKEDAWLKQKEKEGAKVLPQKVAKEVFRYGNNAPDYGSDYEIAKPSTPKEKVVLTKHPNSGALVELVKKSDQPKTPRKKEKWELEHEAQRKKEKAQRELDEAVGKKLVPTLLARVEKWTGADEKRFWRWRCEDLLEYAADKPLVSLERRQLQPSEAYKKLDTFNTAELRALAIELEYLEGTRLTAEMAEAFGVDKKKLEAEVKAEAKAAEKGEAKPAAKAGKKKAA